MAAERYPLIERPGDIIYDEAQYEGLAEPGAASDFLDHLFFGGETPELLTEAEITLMCQPTSAEACMARYMEKHGG